MNNYDRRWNNAVRIWTLIGDLVSQGYAVRDDEDSLVSEVNINLTAKSINTKQGGCNYLWYEYDTDSDQGSHTTISDYNARFSRWSIYKKVDLKEFLK